MNLIQDSPEWHLWRKEGVGASEIPSIYPFTPDGSKIEPYDTPHGVWLVKSGRSKGFAGNSFTEHGKELEAAARARYELVNMTDMPPACATHPKFPICRASLDGWNQEIKTILEIKCPKGRSVIDAALAGKVAEHYLPQVQYQLAVTGAEFLEFYVYHSETETDALVKVVPDLKYQGKLINAAVEFWEHYVLTDTPPPLTDRDVKVIDNNSDLLKLSEIIISQKDSVKKAALDLLKMQFVKMGGHSKVKCGRVQVSTVNRHGAFSYHKLTVSDDSQGESA